MKVTNRIDGDFANPHSSAWSSVAAEAVALAPVALAAQPTEYIREARANRPYGKTAGVR